MPDPTLRLDVPEPEPRRTPLQRFLASAFGRTKNEPWKFDLDDAIKLAVHWGTVLVTVGGPVCVAVATYAPQIAAFLREHEMMGWAAGFLVSLGAVASRGATLLLQGRSAPVSPNDPTASPRDPQVVGGIDVVPDGGGPGGEFVVVRPPE